MLEQVSSDTVYAAIKILGSREFDDEDMERDVLALVTDELTVRRLVDIIPEAFGLVLISHLSGAAEMNFPLSFYAKDAKGSWSPVPFDREPIFAAALQIAQHMFHNGPRDLLKNLAFRSAIFRTVNNALNQGAPLERSDLGGPHFFGIPASIYDQGRRRFQWRCLKGLKK